MHTNVSDENVSFLLSSESTLNIEAALFILNICIYLQDYMVRPEDGGTMFPETLLFIYKTIRCQNPEDHVHVHVHGIELKVNLVFRQKNPKEVQKVGNAAKKARK